MGCVKIFPLEGDRGGAQGPLMQIWDPHITSKTTGARKLKLTTSSAIADKPRDAGLYSCWGMAGLFVSM